MSSLVAEILHAVDTLVERHLKGETIERSEWKAVRKSIKNYRRQHPLNQFIDRDLQAPRLYLIGTPYQAYLSAQTILDQVNDHFNFE